MNRRDALNERLARNEQAMLRRMSDTELEVLAYGGGFKWLSECTDGELRRMAEADPRHPANPHRRK